MAAHAAGLILRRGQTTRQREARACPESARKRPVTERDNAALQASHAPAVELALTEVEPNPYAEVAQELWQRRAGHRIGTDLQNAIEQGEGLLHLDVRVHVHMSQRHPGLRLLESSFPLGQFISKVLEGRMKHRSHVGVLGLQNLARGLFNLAAKLFNLPLDLGVNGYFGRLWPAPFALCTCLDGIANSVGPANSLYACHDRLQRESKQALSINRVVVAFLPLGLHVRTASVERPTRSIIPADGAVHHGAATVSDVENPRCQWVRTRIRRPAFACLGA